MDKELRCLGSIEARSDGDKPQIVGYAAVFNTETNIADMFRETIAPGAFADAIKTDDVRALFNHDANYVLGRSASGTLKMSEDKKGLHVEIDPDPSQTWARDLMAAMKRGDINQMSFAFLPVQQSWKEEVDKLPLRIIERVKLYDVSVVTYPAFPTTSAAVRSLDAYRSLRRPSLAFTIRMAMKRRALKSIG